MLNNIFDEFNKKLEIMKNPPLVFYHKMSELFYAIAATHKSVGATEYNLLKKLISDEWKNLDPQQYPFRNYALEKIEIVFDWFDYEELDSNECFDSFVEYKNDNPELYTDERKTLIWDTANVIANFFAQKDNHERKLLKKLKPLLDKESD